MKKLDYQKLMHYNPTVYSTFKNANGDEFQLVEHPTFGDEYPVIIVHHESQQAVVSDFYDTDDLLGGEDYEPIIDEGEIKLAYECR